MTSKKKLASSDVRPLELLGITIEEERAYRALLHEEVPTSHAIAERLGLSTSKTERILDRIEAKGLVTRSPERPRRYVAISPDVALKDLAIKKKDEMLRTEHAIEELQKEYATSKRSEQEEVLELIASREGGKRVFENMLNTARHEVLAFVRLPLLYNPLEMTPEEDTTQSVMEANGVLRRTISDTEFVSAPGASERIKSNIGSGEDARVFPSLPFKMVLADHRIALIPLHPDRADSLTLVVRNSALLDALYTLFEIFWERSTPISFKGESLELGASKAPISEEITDTVSLLAAGLPDKLIARQLNISVSTVTRRISELMSSLDASSRFQLGWLCALRIFKSAAKK